MDLQTWHEICRQQDEERATAENGRLELEQRQRLSPAEQQLSPTEQRVLRRWSNISGLTLVYMVLGGWVGTLLFGLLWLPGLPNALLSYAYRPVAAEITLFEPKPCERQVGGKVSRGIRYTYRYEEREYSSSHVLPFPLTNDYLDNCGKSFWASLQRGKADPRTGHWLTTAYVNPVIPMQAVLRRGIPVSLVGLWGLFSLICLLLGGWGWAVQGILRARGQERPSSLHLSPDATSHPFDA